MPKRDDIFLINEQNDLNYCQYRYFRNFLENVSLEEASVIYKLLVEYIMSHCAFKICVRKHLTQSLLLTCLCS